MGSSKKTAWSGWTMWSHLRYNSKIDFESGVSSHGGIISTRRKSAAASANIQSRNVTIFGSAAVALGHTIQKGLDTGSAMENGRTKRPLIRSQAASVVRASAIPCPSMAASMVMLARLSTVP